MFRVCTNIHSDLPINRYNYQLRPIVVVGREKHTQLPMHVLVLRERTEDFVFIFKTFKEL